MDDVGSGQGLPYKFKKVSSEIHALSDSESDDDLESLVTTPSLVAVEENKQPEVNDKKVNTISKDKFDSVSSAKRQFDKVDKPLCEYGSRCYRKNPQHLEQYRHIDTDEPAVKQLLISPVSSHYGFYLTKVSGIDARHNSMWAIHIRDILSSVEGNLVKSAQFNYMFDVEWLINQYDKAFRDKPLLLVHGCKGGELRGLQQETAHLTNITLCQAPLDIMYGTHHTKMMLLLYETGLRVVIHTANLIHGDWHQKTQGVWMSPIFARLPDSASAEDRSVSQFKRDLIQYLTAYKVRQLDEWIALIKRHDMSSARVVLIGSVPGRHTGEEKSSFGHLKLGKVLHHHGPQLTTVSKWPIIGQFSSIGSLGPDKTSWLCAEWLTSLASTTTQRTSLPSLLLVFPSKENVRQSLEGYVAGGSLPYSIDTARKQPYLNEFLHQWKSDHCGRTRASPHVKTYCCVSPDWSSMAWFLVTSANLSKAAWGALEKSGSQLMVRSYELGVLFLPKLMDQDSEVFPIGHGNDAFLLPYDLPLSPYKKDDRPWLWDIAYTDLPDSQGTCWRPHH